MKSKSVCVIALATFVATIDQAFAGFFNFTPNPPAVPEFDGLGSVAAMALLVSVVAIAYQRARRTAAGGSSE
jgi:hypothetical protein